MWKKISMLIVEDDPALQKLLAESVRADCDVVVASNGDEALAIAGRVVPEIILLDVGLPKMSGYDVCRTLKADPRFASTPVLFLTSYDSVDKEIIGLDAGAIDYIKKPVDFLLLKSRLKNHFAAIRDKHRNPPADEQAKA